MGVALGSFQLLLGLRLDTRLRTSAISCSPSLGFWQHKVTAQHSDDP